ncbi:MAG TPA: hypothetical protein ENK99_02065 [Campylobacterales bacterium]|jgi:protein tyrosine phosphatase (PTP) superfamily phosphohydrolase (DUF442 family)|nr:hypothetical protein [Campylobacterales bacterium]
MKLPNYIKINEQIATSGQPTNKQFKKIAKDGFEVVINLAMHNKGALKEEDKIVSKNGMVYIHLPITWKDPERDRLKLFLKLLETFEKENKKILVHCIMNYRASVFMHLYKKFVWKEKNPKFIAPKEYKPNKIWRRFLKLDLRD